LEADFSALAASLDRVSPQARELFLAKLVILLCAQCAPGTLNGLIQRASANLPANQ
jgi:hypothetical protein